MGWLSGQAFETCCLFAVSVNSPKEQEPVVQNFVSLISSLRPQLIKFMPTT